MEMFKCFLSIKIDNNLNEFIHIYLPYFKPEDLYEVY